MPVLELWSAPLQQGGRLAEGAIRRVPAPVIETRLAKSSIGCARPAPTVIH